MININKDLDNMNLGINIGITNTLHTNPHTPHAYTYTVMQRKPIHIKIQ